MPVSIQREEHQPVTGLSSHYTHATLGRTSGITVNYARTFTHTRIQTHLQFTFLHTEYMYTHTYLMMLSHNSCSYSRTLHQNTSHHGLQRIHNTGLLLGFPSINQ